MLDKDIEAVSALCIASFSKSVADSLSEEGVLTFSKIAAGDAFLKRMKEDNVMLVAESGGEIEGIIELKEGRHIAMLFVRPEKQKQGIGRALLSSILTYVRFDTLTVRASLSSVPAYMKYGFEIAGDIAEFSGLVYQPMEFDLKCQSGSNRSHVS
ncbi:MAG: GNAT family N-acetyltransferase [Oceanospirillales bacterium]|nr:GNAT family N-acetyltransferase [Oceanospirillales bacterium]